MNERRISRLQEQIKHCLAQVLLRDLGDPKLGMVTITRVELDSEFTQCKAFWSVIGDDKQQKQSAGVLRRARGLCQRAIGKAVRARSLPHLEFHYDQGISGAIGLNQLMAELSKEREQREAERAAQLPADGEAPQADAPADPASEPPSDSPRQDS